MGTNCFLLGMIVVAICQVANGRGYLTREERISEQVKPMYQGNAASERVVTYVFLCRTGVHHPDTSAVRCSEEARTNSFVERCFCGACKEDEGGLALGFITVDESLKYFLESVQRRTMLFGALSLNL